jgi:hypothetical protein
MGPGIRVDASRTREGEILAGAGLIDEADVTESGAVAEGAEVGEPATA